jgi:hypothetical protein
MRYLDPKVGRFISPDPVWESDNPYPYTQNNPINVTDKSGLCTDPLAINFDDLPEWQGGEQCIYPWTGTEYPIYAAWESGTYSGCQMCHTSQAVWDSTKGERFIPTNLEMQIYNSTLQKRFFIGGIIFTVTSGCGALFVCLTTPGCPQTLLALWNVLDWVDDTALQASALAGNPDAQTQVMILYQTGALSTPLEGPFDFAQAILRSSTQKEFIEYFPLDSLGRATGARTLTTEEFMEKQVGTSASINDVPGFRGASQGHARGHLIGKMFGGSGDIPENLVTLLHSPVNNSLMVKVENEIHQAIMSGQKVYYEVNVTYIGDTLIPAGLELFAVGDGGLQIYKLLVNPPGVP